MTPLKRLCDLNTRVLREDTDPHFDFLYADLAAVNLEARKVTPRVETFSEAPSRARRLVFIGDSLIPSLTGSTNWVQTRPLFIKGVELASIVFSTGFFTVTPRPGLDSRFLNYTLASLPILQQLEAHSSGVTMKGFSAEALGNQKIPVPDIKTQCAIAEYLDTETARIDALIAKKQRIRTVLSERLDVVLSNVFSGATGRRCRLKDLLLAPISYGVLVPRLQDDGGVPFIRSGDLVDLSSRSSGLVHIPNEQSAEYRRTVVAPGDLLVCVVGSVGVSAVVPRELAGANTARAVARVQLAREIPVQLILAWTRSWDYRCQVELSTGGDTAQPTLNVGDLKNFKLTLPNDLGVAETEIKKHLHDYTESTAAVDRQLALLAERRQVLITAAVTGEIEIPGVVA
jgi:type I restriction enzyme S subunit